MDILNLIFRASTQGLTDAQRELDKTEDKTRKVQQGADKVEQAFGKLSSVGGPIGEVASKMDDLKGSVDDVFSAARMLGPAFIAAVGAAGVLAAIRFADVLDDLGDLAAKLGLSSTQTLILKQEMDDAGISVDTYQKALDRAAKALSKADEEGKAASEAMKTLGINLKETTTPQELLNKLSEEYSEKLKTGSISAQEQASIQLVLGKSYREAMIAIEANATAQQRLNEYQQLGIGISADGEKATSDLQTANKELQFILQSVGSKLVGEVVPAFSGLIGALSDSYKNGGLVRVAFDGIRGAAQLVMVPIRALFNAFIQLDAAITSVGKGLGAVFAAIATRSLEPLAAWREEVGKIWETANGRTTAAWAWDSGSVAPTQTAGLATGGNPKPKAGGGSAGKDNDPTKDPAYREAMRIAQERQRTRIKEDEDIAKAVFGWREEENKANKKAAEEAEKAAEKETEALLKKLGVFRDFIDPTAKYRAEMSELVKLNEAGKVSSEQLAEGMLYLEDQIAKASGAVKEQTNELSIMERIGQTAFKGLEDSLMTFVSTGKLNFKSFVSSILLDLARLIIQINVIQPLLKGFSTSFGAGGGGFGSLLGNIVGAFSGAPKLATGTNYVPYDGMPAILHEGEAVVPKRYNPAAGGSAAGGTPNITIQVTVQGGSDPEKTGNAVAGKVQELFVRGIVRQELQTQTRARAIAV